MIEVRWEASESFTCFVTVKTSWQHALLKEYANCEVIKLEVKSEK